MCKSIKRGLVMLIAFAMVVMYMPATPVYAASRTTATVSTQKQLAKALKKKSIKTITISTSKKTSLAIPKGNYKSKKITVKGKKLTVTNKGRIGKVTVRSAVKFSQSGRSSSINDQADDSYLVLNKNSDTDNVNTSGEDIRIIDNAKTDITADDSVTAIIGSGAEGTTVDLNDEGTESSVLNKSDNNVKLDVDDESNNLSPGATYNGMQSDNSQVDESNPFKNFCGMTQSGSLSLEIHGYGNFASMSSDSRIHGWYHNMTTGTDYECFFIIDGRNVAVEHVYNPNYEKNYKGDAAFEITATDGTSMTIKSTNDTYGDNGTEYKFQYDTNSNNNNSSGSTVDQDNPLKIFSGCTSSYPLDLEIHGCGMFSNMSQGNSIHGWYRNNTTGTAYECRYIVNGSSVTTEHIDNCNYEKNYLGNAAFEITAHTDSSVTMKSTNNVYGDEGTSYVFWTSVSSGSVETDNPLKPFSSTYKSGILRLTIHGSGEYSSMSHGNAIHGWYQNLETGTNYETRMVVEGDKIYCTHISNSYCEKAYKGDAEFKIISSDTNSITLQSNSNVYGDEGQTYTFSKNDPNGVNGPSAVADDNPLKIFSTESKCGKLNLEIHGHGEGSELSYGYHVHGWYHNSATKTAYECWFDVEGNNVVAKYYENKTCEKNYKGDAAFEITASSKKSVTMKSTNNIYADEGTVYSFKAN